MLNAKKGISYLIRSHLGSATELDSAPLKTVYVFQPCCIPVNALHTTVCARQANKIQCIPITPQQREQRNRGNQAASTHPISLPICLVPVTGYCQMPSKPPINRVFQGYYLIWDGALWCGWFEYGCGWYFQWECLHLNSKCMQGYWFYYVNILKILLVQLAQARLVQCMSLFSPGLFTGGIMLYWHVAGCLSFINVDLIWLRGPVWLSW